MRSAASRLLLALPCGRARDAGLSPARRPPAPPPPPPLLGTIAIEDQSPPIRRAARRGDSRPSCGGCCWHRGCSRRPGGRRGAPDGARAGRVRRRVRRGGRQGRGARPGPPARRYPSVGGAGRASPSIWRARASSLTPSWSRKPEGRAGAGPEPSLSALVVRITRDLVDGVAAAAPAAGGLAGGHAALVADGGELREEAIRIVGERKLRDEVPTLLKLLGDRRRNRPRRRAGGADRDARPARGERADRSRGRCATVARCAGSSRQSRSWAARRRTST